MLIVSIMLYVMLLVLFVFVWRRSTPVRSVPTPLLIFVVFECVGTWPSTISAELTGYSHTGAYPVLITGMAFTAMLAGFVLSMAVLKHQPASPGAFRDQPVIRAYSDTGYLIVMIGLACTLTGLGFYLYLGPPPLAQGLIALARGSSLDNAIGIIASGRFDVTKAYYLGEASYRGQGIIRELEEDAWPYLVGLAASLFMLTRKRGWLFAAIPFFFLMIFFVAGTGQRWQVLQAIICVAVVLSLVVKAKPRWLVTTGFAIILLYIGLSRVNSQFSDISNVSDPTQTFASRAADRVALGNGLHNIDVINFVSDGQLQLGMGKIHLQAFEQSVPGYDKTVVPFEGELWHLMHPEAPISDTTWATTTYFGLAYADWGLAGAVISYAILGAMLAFGQCWVFAQAKHLLVVPFLGFAIYYLGQMSLDGPAGPVIHMVIIGGLYLAMRCCLMLADAPIRQDSAVPMRLAQAVRVARAVEGNGALDHEFHHG